MTVATQHHGGGSVERSGSRGGGPSGLADVVELILDKGLVIDVFVRVSLIGIEILTIDARIVVASVDTFLRFAEATNRLDLYGKGKGAPTCPASSRECPRVAPRARRRACSRRPSRRSMRSAAAGTRSANTRRRPAGVPGDRERAKRNECPHLRIRADGRRYAAPQ